MRKASVLVTVLMILGLTNVSVADENSAGENRMRERAEASLDMQGRFNEDGMMPRGIFEGVVPLSLENVGIHFLGAVFLKESWGEFYLGPKARFNDHFALQLDLGVETDGNTVMPRLAIAAYGEYKRLDIVGIFESGGTGLFHSVSIGYKVMGMVGGFTVAAVSQRYDGEGLKITAHFTKHAHLYVAALFNTEEFVKNDCHGFPLVGLAGLIVNK